MPSLLLLLGCPAQEPTDTDLPTDPATEATADTGPERPPNVLIVLADDVGLDNIGAYGVHEQSAPTPTIDQLAAEGVRFDRTWGAVSCSPARAQLLTGRFGRRYGLGSIIRQAPGSPSYDLPAAEKTIAELAKEQGYSTAFIGKWHLTTYDRDWTTAPGRHGFDRYRFNGGNLPIPSVIRPAGYFEHERVDNGHRAFVQGYVTTVQSDDAIAELADLPEPWLMVLAYNAAHEPFHAPPAHLRPQSASVGSSSTIAQKYRAMVEAMDTELGRVLSAVEPVRDHTYVVFAADNGTPLQALLPPTPFDQGKATFQEGGLQVPLIVAGPGVQPGVTQALTQLTDVYPTVASWIGATTLPELDGVALQPWLDEPTAPDARTYQYTSTFSEHDQPDSSQNTRIAIRDRRWKYKTNDAGEWLFDLQHERYDQGGSSVAEDPAHAAELARLQAAIGSIQTSAPFENTGSTP